MDGVSRSGGGIFLAGATQMWQCEKLFSNTGTSPQPETP
jgi:hypothetical protein